MKYDGLTDIGLMRKSNQDSFVVITNDTGDVLGVVCDGIGGARAGDVASMLVCTKLQERFLAADKFTSALAVRRWLKKNVEEVNKEVYQTSLTNPSYLGMGTTMVCFIAMKDAIIIANAGDSRCYTLSDGVLHQITNDHTIVYNLLLKGEITKEEMMFHPQRHILSNALGVMDDAKLDIYTLKNDVDSLLLSSDGLHGYVGDDEILSVLKGKNKVKAKCQRLVELANLKGGFDNVTVIILER